MSTYRDKKTNITLAILGDLIDGSEEELTFPITLVVGGQIITGTMISEKEFYKLEVNLALKNIHDFVLKEKSEFFNEDGTLIRDDMTAEEIEKIPDTLWQRFLYLKDARYMTGNSFIPSEVNAGSAIQVRAADVVAFNFGTFSSSKSE
jgi:hypothetical protein